MPQRTIRLPSLLPPVSAATRAVALCCLVGTGLAGCLSPTTLEQAVLAYNSVTTETLMKQLLLNIAYARHHQPIHFTGVVNIAATFNYQFNAGVTPALTGNSGALLAPIIGGGVADNPTFSIVPIEGEEFTKRLLTPIQENKVTLLIRQGIDIDLLLRLMASEFRVARENDRDAVYQNRPTDREGYARFRRAVLHLSSIQDRNQLYVEPLVFERTWDLPADALGAGDFEVMQKEYTIQYDPLRRLYHLSRRVTGRIVLTNYDPDQLSNEERVRLNGKAEQIPPNGLLVDIRPQFPGGQYPIKGEFRMRSFQSVLTFLGRDIAEEPEFPVPLDPRTPPVRENPVHTLEVVEARRLPPGADLSVRVNGLHYAVKPESGYPWNREAFRMLYVLFQMTVTDLPQFGVPSITIAK